VAETPVVTPTQDTEAAARLAQEQAEAQRLAAEAEAAEQLAAERIAQEQAVIEAQHLADQQAEAARLAAAQLAAAQVAADKLAEQQAEAARLAVEAEAAQMAAAQLAAAQMAADKLAEQQAEAARLAAAQREAELLAAEQAELARLAVEQHAAEALAAEQLASQALAREQAEALAQQQAETEQAAELQPEPQARPVKEGLFARLKRGLLRTSENIGSGFIGLFRGKKIDDDLFEELEEQLLIADVGVETTTRLIKNLTEHASRKQLKNAEALYELLREELQKTLDPVAIPLVPDNANGPFVILMVGVNGVGKTTTIGKLAKQYQSQGKSVMLAAGDTFRAAAVEQLQVWGQRNNITVIAQHTGADSASVLFDALQAAKARKVDVLIADTAGRLQNKAHLMEELKKVVRVMKKLDPDTPHEVMLTLDASTGQNAISQAQLFQEAVGVTGITISKLDGTAKGGVVFAIADKFNIPIRYIGVGEQIDDLRTFNSKEFIDALFTQEKADS
ncbi:MAG: signal recognition particle-docking protein FtsY, partial [Shewanella sp.]